MKSKNIAPDVPLFLDAWLIHNLPFYTERKAMREQSPNAINAYAMENETLAFLPIEHLKDLDFEYNILWQGLIYNFASESQFFKYVVATNNAIKGNTEKFAEFVLIYKP